MREYEQRIEQMDQMDHACNGGKVESLADNYTGRTRSLLLPPNRPDHAQSGLDRLAQKCSKVATQCYA